LAAREGRDATVECLVNKEANISIKDNHGVRIVIRTAGLTFSLGSPKKVLKSILSR